jgi:hypothetical protein
MKKQMNKVLQQEGADLPFVSQGGQFRTMDQKGLAPFHIAK